MARNFDPVKLTGNQWVLLNSPATAISAISFQVQDGVAEIHVKATLGLPAATTQGWVYSATGRDGELKKPLTDMASAVTDTGFVYARGAEALLVVDHA